MNKRRKDAENHFLREGKAHRAIIFFYNLCFSQLKNFAFSRLCV